ncbi:acyl-homoserine-lactone synthase [Bradyrhizobium sp. OHSU_III]|jgi:acyl-homoserine lactone synthase|uniref:acyl-homoserine-lactone synthase n=1 Tax=Bradyrhizobium sp. OHSU_III TaxID=1297865 RepID=UPI001FCB2587|nr:acyl-homoserine-lactone synthase [Bradyrhizobium sp. OHSU_III]
MLMVIPGSDIGRHAALMDRAFRFRHAIFVDEKGWSDLRQPDGRECDRFDDAYAIHHVCLRGDDIVGYQRLLPTTRPHLLSDVLTDCQSAFKFGSDAILVQHGSCGTD